MLQYTQKEFIRICEANGFKLNRTNGSHAIYTNNKGRHISIPNNLNICIARRLIRENQLELNIKKLKKMQRTCDNYPLGAAEDKAAPYNEPLDVDHKRYVSLSISFDISIFGHPDISEEMIEKEIRDKINSSIPFDANIDELIILKE